MKLVINRIKYDFTINENQKIFFSKEESIKTFPLKYESILRKFSKTKDHEKIIEWGNRQNISNEDNVYLGFKSINNSQIECNFIEYFKPKLIRSTLIEQFENKENILLEPFAKFSDMNIYKYIKEFNSIWNVYQRYDILIKHKYNELCISIGSNFTLISKQNIEYKEEYNNVKYINNNGYISSFPILNNNDRALLIANYEIKKSFAISDTRNNLIFKNKHDLINSFYFDFLKGLEAEGLSFYSNGLMNVNVRDIYKVNMYENKMIFKDGKTDINPITGMRNYGIFQPSNKALINKFLFIYENKDDANNLYKYLKNGLRNFPGLERYVGIPVTLSDKRFSYSNIKNIVREIENFKNKELSEDYYKDIFAIVIGQFDKNATDDEKTEAYYEIKNELLKKGISSQFINQDHIRQSNSFNYHLPNIAIGILAKLGGIPWRLKNSVQSELIIGFNQAYLKNNQYIGSSVFFTNEGVLKGTYAYPASESEQELIGHLRNSINSYTNDNGEIRRLIIHYYKPSNEKETKKIKQLLYDELKINIPFAIVEVNDTKSQTDICFDANYNFGMPESGTYIRVGRDEYLLFNNTRYETKPINSIKEELPIKVKIHFADTNGFSHSELIGQVYEFSRLIWKGLKQRSQPATTIYAKLIADFSAHFKGNIPNNNVTNNTPWFL
jgi:hypothetical protein